MMEKILYGKAAMEHYVAQAKARADALKERGISPKLCVVRVGNDPAAENYEASIRRRGEMVGVEIAGLPLAEDISLQALCDKMDEVSCDPAIHGILLYLPLPGTLHGHEAEVLKHLAPKKDVDGVTEASAAKLYLGEKDGFAPCTAEACIRLMEFYGVEFSGKTACVVGRSGVIGKPVSMLLLGKNATVTVAHSKTQDLASVANAADILIACAGRAGLIGGAHVKKGAVVIDVGANWVDGKIVGDVLFDEAEEKASAISPVPGGVGMVTSTVLMEHVIASAEKM